MKNHERTMSEQSDGGSAVAEEARTRTPVEIEADIARRREQLAATLDELAVRVHPKTIADGAKAKAGAAVDRTVGRAYTAAARTAAGVRDRYVDEEGSPRWGAVLPTALVAVAVAGGLAVLSGRRRSRR